MVDAFVGEIRMLGFAFVPANGSTATNAAWAFCNGQTVPWSQYQALAAVIGTIYGGDSKNTIGLPNLTGAAVMGADNGTAGEQRPDGILDSDSDLMASTYALGTSVGTPTVAIPAAAGVPFHAHLVQASNVPLPPANAPPMTGMTATPSTTTSLSRPILYNSSTKTYVLDRAFTKTFPGANGPTLAAGTISQSGGVNGQAQPHENRQPYLVLNFCISLLGIYPA